MAAGARRDPAAERRILEALREVAQRESVRRELRFERGAEDAALDQRRARGAVDLVHPAHVRRSIVTAPLKRVSSSRDSTPPHDARLPPPKGVTVASTLAGPVEHGRDVRFVARIGDDVGRIVVVAEQAAHGVGKRLAVGVRGALV